ncbi:hypothetical protein GQ55_2G251600 [Panicum hallii var. hallii]|uniref:Uncharacterized protein n=1 Tax=Panicum hallii var. hallii TaxID=1504633 RepID=A0A2T7ES49_9POAL|nr:hypothetical protein GQ55_2G251600 [Panicum hallii var. hallii]
MNPSYFSSSVHNAGGCTRERERERGRRRDGNQARLGRGRTCVRREDGACALPPRHLPPNLAQQQLRTSDVAPLRRRFQRGGSVLSTQ